MNIRNWVKNHKKEFTAKYIRESGAKPNQDKPSCIFMAGLPGAGKTEFTKTIIKELNIKVVRIDMDEIASMIDTYKPEHADMFRSGATSLQNSIYQKCKKEYYPFIMDGTLSHETSMNCIKSLFNRGYAIKKVYIKQDPLRAWQFTKAREKVEHRAIDKNGFIKCYGLTINNLLSLKKYKNIKVDIIIKDKHNDVGKRIIDIKSCELDNYIKLEYNIKDLERMLSDE